VASAKAEALFYIRSGDLGYWQMVYVLRKFRSSRADGVGLWSMQWARNAERLNPHPSLRNAKSAAPGKANW